MRQAFEENFFRRHELGAAFYLYHRGRKVVDLWGGIPLSGTIDDTCNNVSIQRRMPARPAYCELADIDASDDDRKNSGLRQAVL